MLHRGKIGGGRVGIGKKTFFNNFLGGYFEPVNDDGIEAELLLIGSLNSRHFIAQVSNFINGIDRIKNLKKKGKIDSFSKLQDFSYTKEHTGTSTVKQRSITIKRTHGIVVHALAKRLESQGYKIGKDGNRDLFIHKRGRITTLFEVKRDASTQDLCTAVGQLLIYSIPIKTKVGLILVVPDMLSNEVIHQLHKLGIKVLYYRWSKDEPKFQNLNRLV